MIDLIYDIDCLIQNCIPTAKSYGVARLVEYESQTIPTTYNQDGSQGEKITPNDRWGIIYYHRLLEETLEDSEIFSFGRISSQLSTQRIKTVLVVDIKKGHKVINQLLSSIAGQSLDNANYKFAEIGSSFSINRDSGSVFEAEWGEAYKDKFQMRYFVYAIEYTVQYLPCVSCECN